MRHDAHYVESLTSYSGAAVGRMIRVDQIRPNPDQPRKALGDLRELTESIREKGVLEPLLVRYVPREDCFHIISGERRYHASRAAGLRELPCIEKTADDAETLEIGLIENIQRKDLTPFEEADGLHRLSTQFEYTHEDIAKKIGRARSSVTETLSLRNIQTACSDGAAHRLLQTASGLSAEYSRSARFRAFPRRRRSFRCTAIRAAPPRETRDSAARRR